MGTPPETPAVLVTGGSSGIGLATAGFLIEHGCRVCLLARDPHRLEAAVDRLASRTGAADAVTTATADVTRREELQAAVEGASARLGVFTHAVCSAGAFLLLPFEATSPRAFATMVDANLTGVFNTISVLLPGFYESGSGHILAVGSIAAKQPFPGNAAYSASKYGLRGLMEVLAIEANPRGITVSMIHPPAVDTPLWDRLDAEGGAQFDRGSFLGVEEVGRKIADLLLSPPALFNDLDLF